MKIIFNWLLSLINYLEKNVNASISEKNELTEIKNKLLNGMKEFE